MRFKKDDVVVVSKDNAYEFLGNHHISLGTIGVVNSIRKGAYPDNIEVQIGICNTICNGHYTTKLLKAFGIEELRKVGVL